MYMTNLYAYDKKLYLITKRDFWERWEYEQERSRGDILDASENCREKKKKRRGERERNRFISALRNKRKKSIRLNHVYRFTRLIGNKFIYVVSIFVNIIALISFNRIYRA